MNNKRKILTIDNYLSHKINLINRRLAELIKTSNLNLLKAARYAINAPAKRLRPLLVIATAESFNQKEDIALDAACAIELIHTYSLIHDDLPCMDDDDLRRGKPSLHKAFPEFLALLTGDFFLSLAFEVIANCKNLGDSQKIKLIKILAKRAGGEGMIHGQAVDLVSQGKNISWKQVKEMHLKKTADLIIASLEFGGVIGTANSLELHNLRHIGRNLGLAFQIVDDILDLTSSSSILGKPVQSDIFKNKPTSVSVLGIDEARKIIGNLNNNMLFYLEKLNFSKSLLKKLIRKMINRKF